MNGFNPYSVLNVPDFSDLNVVEEAYLKLQDQYYSLPKHSNKQAQQFSRIQDAYDLLCHPIDKELVDTQLMAKNARNTNIHLTEPKDLLDKNLRDQESEEVESEFSREKNMGLSNSDKSNPMVSIAIMLGIFFAGSFLYGKLAKNEVVEVKEEKKPQQIVEQAPIRPSLISEDATQIRSNVLYPDTSYLQQKEIIYAPDGSPFPMEAMVIPSLPNSNDGSSTIIVQNPRNTAVFGKTVVKYSQTTTPIINRYFYIPAKGTLHLFNMPSGTYQVLVMTLNNPTAFASSIFTIPIATNQTVTQLANWNYPFQASSLF